MADKETRKRKKRKEAVKKVSFTDETDDSSASPPPESIKEKKSSTEEHQQQQQQPAAAVLSHLEPSQFAKVIFFILFTLLIGAVGLVFIALPNVDREPVELWEDSLLQDDESHSHGNEGEIPPVSSNENIQNILNENLVKIEESIETVKDAIVQESESLLDDPIVHLDPSDLHPWAQHEQDDKPETNFDHLYDDHDATDDEDEESDILEATLNTKNNEQNLADDNTAQESIQNIPLEADAKDEVISDHLEIQQQQNIKSDNVQDDTESITQSDDELLTSSSPNDDSDEDEIEIDQLEAFIEEQTQELHNYEEQLKNLPQTAPLPIEDSLNLNNPEDAIEQFDPVSISELDINDNNPDSDSESNKHDSQIPELINEREQDDDDHNDSPPDELGLNIEPSSVLKTGDASSASSASGKDEEAQDESDDDDDNNKSKDDDQNNVEEKSGDDETIVEEKKEAYEQEDITNDYDFLFRDELDDADNKVNKEPANGDFYFWNF